MRPIFRSGRLRTALDISASIDNKIGLGSNAVLDQLNPLTFWAIAYKTPGGGHAYGKVVNKGTGSGGNKEWSLDNDVDLHAEFQRSGANSTAISNNAPLAVAGAWYFICLQFDEGGSQRIRFFTAREGGLVSEVSYGTVNAGSGTITDDSGDNWNLGNRDDSSRSGRLKFAEFGFHGSVLSVEQMQRIWLDPDKALLYDPLAFGRCGDNELGIVIDETGHGNDGIYSGSTLLLADGPPPIIKPPRLVLSHVISAVGASAGTSTIAGVGVSTAVSVAASAGTSTVAGIGVSVAEAIAVAAGTSTVAGVATSLAKAIAASAGTSAVTGIGVSTAEAVAASAGTSTTTGIGLSLAEAIAAAAGTSAVTGIGISTAEAIAAAAGTSTVSGVGAGKVLSVAIAAGLSTAAGIGAATAASIATAAGIAEALGIAGVIHESDRRYAINLTASIRGDGTGQAWASKCLVDVVTSMRYFVPGGLNPAAGSGGYYQFPISYIPWHQYAGNFGGIGTRKRMPFILVSVEDAMAATEPDSGSILDPQNLRWRVIHRFQNTSGDWESSQGGLEHGQEFLTQTLQWIESWTGIWSTSNPHIAFGIEFYNLSPSPNVVTVVTGYNRIVPL